MRSTASRTHDRFVAPRIRAADRAGARARDALPRGVDPGSPRQPARRRRPRTVGAPPLGSPAAHLRPAALRGAAARGPRADPVDAGAAPDRGRPRDRCGPTRRSAPFVLPTPPTEQVARAVRYHTPQPSPVVIANGVARALAQRRELADLLSARTPGSSPSAARDVHPWAIGEFGRKVQRLSAQVESNAAGEFQVTAPTVQLAAATTASRRRRAAAAPARRRRGVRCCSRSRSSPPARSGATSRTRGGA